MSTGPPDSHGQASDASAGTDSASPQPRTRRKRSRAGDLVVGALAVAAVAGVIGAAVGLHLHDSRSSMSAPDKANDAPGSPGVSAGSVTDAAGRVRPSVVRLSTSLGRQSQDGSGVVLTADGLIITNAHVVTAPADSGPSAGVPPNTRVTFADGRTEQFRVVGA